MFALVAMISIRTGWPRNEVKRMTYREAQIVLEELSKIDEQQEYRMIEAQHAPNRAFERARSKPKKVNKADPLAGWKQGLGLANKWKSMAGNMIDAPGMEKVQMLDQEMAAIRFLADREKKRRGG